MASSGQADSTLEVKLTADTAAATGGVAAAARDIAGAMQGVARSAEEAGQAAAGSMDQVAQKSRAAAEEVKRVGEHAKMSAGQLRMVAVGMAGMALNAYGAWQDNHGGRSAGTAYAQGILGSGAQGAMMGMMVGGPVGAAIGGVAGAAVGAFTTYQQREAAEKAEAEAREKSIESMRKQIDLYEELRGRTEAFQGTLRRLGDATGDVAERKQWQSDEIAYRTAEDERLAREQREAADRNDTEAFAKLSRERQLNAHELAAIKAVSIEAEPEERRRGAAWLDPAMGDRFAKMGMDLFGGGVNDAATRLAQEGNDIGKQQLAVLNRIEGKRAAGAVWM